jgi:hypothetical protein
MVVPRLSGVGQLHLKSPNRAFQMKPVPKIALTGSHVKDVNVFPLGVGSITANKVILVLTKSVSHGIINIVSAY